MNKIARKLVLRSLKNYFPPSRKAFIAPLCFRGIQIDVRAIDLLRLVSLLYLPFSLINTTRGKPRPVIDKKISANKSDALHCNRKHLPNVLIVWGSLIRCTKNRERCKESYLSFIYFLDISFCYELQKVRRHKWKSLKLSCLIFSAAEEVQLSIVQRNGVFV